MRVIIIHGNGGDTGSDYWYPWLVQELGANGIEAIAPNFPDSQLARAKFWLPFLKNELHAAESAILVGHSSGAVAAMRFAENHHILGSILVGASYTDLDDEDERLSGYFTKPWNWEAIRANQQWIIQFASPTDPYIPIQEARFIADNLKSDYRELPNRGHFTDNTFPELAKVLIKKLNLSGNARG